MFISVCFLPHMVAIEYLSYLGPEESHTSNVVQVGVGKGVQGMLGISHKWLDFTGDLEKVEGFFVISLLEDLTNTIVVIYFSHGNGSKSCHEFQQ